MLVMLPPAQAAPNGSIKAGEGWAWAGRTTALTTGLTHLSGTTAEAPRMLEPARILKSYAHDHDNAPDD